MQLLPPSLQSQVCLFSQGTCPVWRYCYLQCRICSRIRAGLLALYIPNILLISVVCEDCVRSAGSEPRCIRLGPAEVCISLSAAGHKGFEKQCLNNKQTYCSLLGSLPQLLLSVNNTTGDNSARERGQGAERAARLVVPSCLLVSSLT